MGDKTNKLNIYLIREEHSSFDQIIKPDLPEHIIDDVGTFYLEESKANQPSWLKNFFLDELNDFKLFTAGAKGLLLVSIPYKGKQRIFAVVFGHGRHLLNDGVTEERFGLKVVLNSVDPKSLRSIDKTTLGSTSKQSREQMSREGEAAAFGIDIEQDLINAVTGRSNDLRLGKQFQAATDRANFSRPIIDILEQVAVNRLEVVEIQIAGRDFLIGPGIADLRLKVSQFLRISQVELVLQDGCAGIAVVVGYSVIHSRPRLCGRP